MRWTALAFLHWPLSPESLRRFLPPGLKLDLYHGRAWLGVVPFRMENVRHRRLRPLPTAGNFLEINVRTYVIGGNKPGVWFFSLDAESWLAVQGARLGFNLPYHHARMRAERHSGVVAYESRRVDNRHVDSQASPPTFVTRYRPTGDVFTADPGGLEHWLTERYCLFGQSRAGRLYSIDIHHLPWPLQRADAVVERNTLTTLVDRGATRNAPLCHFAESLDVLAWAPNWLDEGQVGRSPHR